APPLVPQRRRGLPGPAAGGVCHLARPAAESAPLDPPEPGRRAGACGLRRRRVRGAVSRVRGVAGFVRRDGRGQNEGPGGAAAQAGAAPYFLGGNQRREGRGRRRRLALTPFPPGTYNESAHGIPLRVRALGVFGWG